MNKQKIYKVIAVAFLIATIQGCENAGSDTYYQMEEQYTSFLNRYRLGDTVLFRNEKGALLKIKLINVGRYTTSKKIKNSISHADNYEVKATILSPKEWINFKFYFGFSTGFSADSVFFFFDIDSGLNAKKVYKTLFTHVSAYRNQLSKIDSLKIESKNYVNLIYLLDAQDSLRKVYLTKDKGIIKFLVDKNRYWYINE